MHDKVSWARIKERIISGIVTGLVVGLFIVFAQSCG